jgi:hypothetical protein
MTLLLYALTAAPGGAAPGGNDKGKGPPDKDPGYQPVSRLLWSVELDAASSQVRPAVANDGRVYAVDALDNLYIVTPNGTSTPEVIAIEGAGGKGLAVDRDNGDVYTGNENWIKAFDLDGNEQWRFDQNPLAFVLSAVAVGPDYNVYAVASNGMGVFSLTPDGTERWRIAEPYDRSNAEYTEIGFGPGAAGGQLYFRVNQNTRGLLTETGEEVFSAALGSDRPVVSPFDYSWHTSDSAYDPAGNELWQFTGFPPATGALVPALGMDGTHYTVNQVFRVFAIDSTGQESWRRELDENVGPPDVDPSNTQLIVPTAVTSTNPAALRTVDTTSGGDLWRVEFPPPGVVTSSLPYVDTGVAFSPDGTQAYVITGVAGGKAVLHAIALDPAIPNTSTVLRSQSVNITANSIGNRLKFSGEVTVRDENRAPIARAAVTATWTSGAGLNRTQTATTDNEGIARFGLTAPGGIYTLTVDDIAKDPYTFDPDHSILRFSKLF